MYLPLFVNEVHAERVSRKFHQPIHSNTKIAISFIFTGIESQPIIHEATDIPAIYTHIYSKIKSWIKYYITSKPDKKYRLMTTKRFKIILVYVHPIK